MQLSGFDCDALSWRLNVSTSPKIDPFRYPFAIHSLSFCDPFGSILCPALFPYVLAQPQPSLQALLLLPKASNHWIHCHPLDQSRMFNELHHGLPTSRRSRNVLKELSTERSGEVD